MATLTRVLTLLTVLTLATPTATMFGLENLIPIPFVPEVLTPDLSAKALLNFGLRSLGITGTLNRIEQSLQDTHKEIFHSVNSVTKKATHAFSRRYSFVMNVVDDHALMGAFAELIPEALHTNYGNNTCIPGIKTKKNHVGTLTLKQGLFYYKTPMDLVTELKEDRGEEQLFNSSFTFPDIWVHFFWKFEGSLFPYVEREGVMTVIQKGPNRVSVFATAPKSRNTLEDIRTQHECFLKVEGFEVAVGEELVVEDVSYESTFKNLMGTSHGGTEYFVRGIISDMAGEIMSQLKRALKSVLAPLTSKEDVFCQKTTKAEPINCDEIKWIGEYWRN